MQYEKKVLRCKICGKKDDFKTFKTKDYNKNGEINFEYSICSYCGCMQLVEIPDNLAEYYGDVYYSFSLKEKKSKGSFIYWLMEQRDIFEITHQNYIGKIMHNFIPRPAYNVIGESIKKSDAILDVGCGDGYLLSLLEKLGYKDLSGCDRFILQDPIKKNFSTKIKLISGTIEQCSQKYQLIMFHHSFEHIENPRETIMQAYQKLRRGGVLLISIPVAGSNAFEKFGRYWVQLDAPRHIFLHSVKSIELLANEIGLLIDEIVFDSSAFQYIGSIQYSRGKDGNYRRSFQGIVEYMVFSFLKYSRMAKKDNICKKGDQATFILRKTD